MLHFTFLSAGDLHYACDGDHVSWHTAVHEVLHQLTLDGARDPPCFPLLVGHELLHPATHGGSWGTGSPFQPTCSSHHLQLTLG